jgi:hypothetical protein
MKFKHFFYSYNFTFLNGEKYKCVCQWENINNELLIISFGENINKILNITIGICATFTMKHGLNKMHPFCLHVKWGFVC